MKITLWKNWIDIVFWDVRLSQAFSISKEGRVDLLEWYALGCKGYNLITWLDDLGGESRLLDCYRELPRRW